MAFSSSGLPSQQSLGWNKSCLIDGSKPIEGPLNEKKVCPFKARKFSLSSVGSDLYIMSFMAKVFSDDSHLAICNLMSGHTLKDIERSPDG